MMTTEPLPEHRWLQRLVGDWTYAIDGPEKPGEECGKWSGSERVRSIGGLWVQAEAEGEMPDGSAATTVMTLGYDPQRQRYVGTWIGSMMTHLWVYAGELDATGKVLTLAAEGPDMATEGKTAQYRDVIEFKSDDHRVLSSHILGDDGTWRGFMTLNFQRKG